LRKKLKCDKLHVHRDHLGSCSTESICMHGHDTVIYSTFHWNPSRGFGATADKIWPFPLLWLLAFTTAVLLYKP